MNLRRWSLLALCASLVLFGGLTTAQESKKDDPKKDAEAKPEPRLRGQLPANFRSLGLDDKQKQEIYKIQNEYDDKILELEAKIKKLKSDERAAIDKVLTPAQKARLKEIRDKSTVEEKPSEKDKVEKLTDKKDPEKKDK